MRKPRDEVRILLIGDRNVGKTSLILSLVRKTEFCEQNMIVPVVSGSEHQ
jgi:GTPase SAR1 family protein